MALRLLNRGFSAVEAEAIMRSKWARWAADESSAEYGKVPAKALTDWLDKNKDKECTTARVRELVAGTI